MAWGRRENPDGTVVNAAWSVADLCDRYPGEAQVIDLDWKHLGGVTEFHGVVETASVEHDNSIIREILSTPGSGRVLVVAGTGAKSTALVGDNLAGLAIENGWSGVVVDGAVRDTGALGNMRVGIAATRIFPRRGDRGPTGSRGADIWISGIQIARGGWIYVDDDGVVYSRGPIHEM